VILNFLLKKICHFDLNLPSQPPSSSTRSNKRSVSSSNPTNEQRTKNQHLKRSSTTTQDRNRRERTPSRLAIFLIQHENKPSRRTTRAPDVQSAGCWFNFKTRIRELHQDSNPPRAPGLSTPRVASPLPSSTFPIRSQNHL
jgi:hypothetical protein